MFISVGIESAELSGIGLAPALNYDKGLRCVVCCVCRLCV